MVFLCVRVVMICSICIFVYKGYNDFYYAGFCVLGLCWFRLYGFLCMRVVMVQII